MKIVSSQLLKRPIAVLLVALLAVPFGEAAAFPRQAAAPPQQQTPPSQLPATAPATSEAAPGSGAGASDAETAPPPSQPSTQQTAQPKSVDENNGPGTPPSGTPQSSASQSSSDTQQNGETKPVGTAAAPYEKPAGVAASRPAGAAIAPAKQRRSRSFLIKVGLIVGAGVALGTVVALSQGSSSRPPH